MGNPKGSSSVGRQSKNSRTAHLSPAKKQQLPARSNRSLAKATHMPAKAATQIGNHI